MQAKPIVRCPPTKPEGLQMRITTRVLACTLLIKVRTVLSSNSIHYVHMYHTPSLAILAHKYRTAVKEAHMLDACVLACFDFAFVFGPFAVQTCHATICTLQQASAWPNRPEARPTRLVQRCSSPLDGGRTDSTTRSSRHADCMAWTDNPQRRAKVWPIRTWPTQA